MMRRKPFLIILSVVAAIALLAALVAFFLMARYFGSPMSASEASVFSGTPTRPAPSGDGTENITPPLWEVVGGPNDTNVLKVTRLSHGGFTATYPSDYTLTNALIGDSFWKITLPPEEKTNLGEVSLNLDVQADTKAVGKCLDFSDVSKNGGATKIKRDIGGTQFSGYSYTEGAAGQRYVVNDYRAVFRGGCYRITPTHHYSVFGIFEPGTVKEFSQPAVDAQLNALLNGIRFFNK